MIELADASSEVGNLDSLEKELDQAVRERISVSTLTPATGKETKGTDPNLPEKLQGKSLAEIADMYQNLESLHGRTANELGTMRTLADRLLDLKRTDDLRLTNNGKPATKPVEITSAELLEKPTEALDRFASSRESALESRLDSRLNRLEQSLLGTQFASKHPDAEVTAKSPEFNEWVRQSRVRQRAAASAAAGDFMVADDLLTEFKASRSARATNKDAETDEKTNLAAARAASLETGAAAKGNAGGDAKAGKVYSRAAIMRLRLEDPEKYYSDDYQTEIQSAYAEGRVK